MVNFLQINLNGNWAAEQLMVQTRLVRICEIVSEPATFYGDED